MNTVAGNGFDTTWYPNQTQLSPNYWYTWPVDHKKCPHCGYCSCCGRSNEKDKNE